MEKILECSNCGKVIKEQSTFCPECGVKLVIKDLTFTIDINITFQKRPENCLKCRFGVENNSLITVGNFTCLLDPDLIFHSPSNFYGFCNLHTSECPLKKNNNITTS